MSSSSCVAHDKEEQFDVLLDVVAARIAVSRDEAALQKMEAGERAVNTIAAIDQISKEEKKTGNRNDAVTVSTEKITREDPRDFKVQVQGTPEDNVFLLKVLRERQEAESPLRQAMNVAASTDDFDLHRNTNPTDKAEALPRTSLARHQEVARRTRAGAYSVAPGFELPTTAATYIALAGVGHSVTGSETHSNLPSDVVQQERPLGNSVLAVANPVDEIIPHDLPQAQEFESQESTGEQETKRYKAGLLLVAIAVLAIITILVTLLVPSKKDDKESSTVTLPSSTPSVAPSMSPEGTIKALLEDDTLLALEDPESPQFRAFEWLLEDPNLHSHSDARIKQKFALGSLYYATSGDTWMDNTSWLSHSIHECAWYNAPEFAQKTLMDSIYQGYMSWFAPSTEPPPTHCSEDGLYHNLWLDNNNLVGSLPEELYFLTSLQTLSLGYNQLDGSLGSLIGQLADLEGLVIFNQPPGGIPSEIGLLSKLRGLLLTNSNHQGVLPSELWQLTNLEYWVLMDHEHMQGTISTGVGMLSKLKWFVLDTSGISGTIPTELGQIEPLEWIVLGRNRLSGSIPSELGFHPNKEHIHLNSNDLVGTIPSELGLLSSPYRLSFFDNHITGTVPSELGLLKDLEHALDLARNLLTGVIPTELGLLTSLHDLLLDHNQLSDPQ
ncbi:Leucine Rich Repeat [Seminavis robusta]|uniref:Leucine Rich Repeat n=1 Tax=Seminavis robusta TaxID=568900 RepID=A0A9N8DBX5_9STRA|nr:Leucine Rich Repeat [Seminavis robusta]|eukprot:Sro52_g030890.1 Leucine Rich Repeat (667) ;mRNA; f:33849-35949